MGSGITQGCLRVAAVVSALCLTGTDTVLLLTVFTGFGLLDDLDIQMPT